MADTACGAGRGFLPLERKDIEKTRALRLDGRRVAKVLADSKDFPVEAEGALGDLEPPG
jgi:hypothetical protein